MENYLGTFQVEYIQQYESRTSCSTAAFACPMKMRKRKENVKRNLSPLQHRTQWGRQRIAWNCFWMHLSIRTWWKLDMVTVSKEIVIVIMITMCYCFYYLISLQGRRLPARSNLITIDAASCESYSHISFIFSKILCFRLRFTWQ